MKLNIISLTKTSAGKKDLPAQFSEEIRPDLIKRAVEAIQANSRQPYGAKVGAGMRYSSKISRRRRDYKGSYGQGISRVPRKILSHKGTRFNWVAAFAPGTVGGRRSHPPKAEKVLEKKINEKERRKAIRSALAATMIKGFAERRGHIAPQEYPFIIENKLETLTKTSDAVRVLDALGFGEELARSAIPKKRAGKGKRRGRRTSQRKGPLIVVSKPCALMASAANIPGIEIVVIDRINADLLAPGADIGRLTIYTEAAIDRLANEHLFTDNVITSKEKTLQVQEKESQKPSEKIAVK